MSKEEETQRCERTRLLELIADYAEQLRKGDNKLLSANQKLEKAEAFINKLLKEIPDHKERQEFKYSEAYLILTDKIYSELRKEAIQEFKATSQKLEKALMDYDRLLQRDKKKK